MLYGRTGANPISRFAEEIPQTLINEDTPYTSRYDGGSRYGGYEYGKPKVYYHADDGYSSQSSSGVGDRATVIKKPQPQSTGIPLCEGDRVKHFTFGEGEILSVRPMGSDVLYEVAFDKVGTKKLMGNYAKLRKL